MSTKLEAIQKALDMYLETKRQIFPRFYFLSNDDVLEILGQSQNPAAMQPHLKKCFDNIKSLRIEEPVSLDKHDTHTHSVAHADSNWDGTSATTYACVLQVGGGKSFATGMSSADGELVTFIRMLHLDRAVEVQH